MKRYQQSTNADQKSIEKVFSTAICCQCGDKWQSKTLFLTIFDLRFSMYLGVFDCRLPGVIASFQAGFIQILAAHLSLTTSLVSDKTWYLGFIVMKPGPNVEPRRRQNSSLYTWSRPGVQASLRQITDVGTENSWAKLEQAVLVYP